MKKISNHNKPYKKPRYRKQTEEKNSLEKVKKPKKKSQFTLGDYKEQLALLVLFLLFITIGSIGLGKFFTTDETFWFTKWVEQYATAYLSGNVADTNFSNYPGVFHSFLCGAVNLFMDNDFLNSKNIETYLFWWRFPILLFNALSLIGVYYLLKKFFSPVQSFTIVFLIAFTPIILGMSRIVNSDSPLWSTTLISILSFIVFVREQKNKYLIISGVFMGMALASKYNAILLFIYQPVILGLEFIFNKIKQKDYKKILLKTLLVWLVALLIFSFFLPAVFVEPKLFRARIFGIFIKNPIFLATIALLSIDTFILKNKIFTFLKDKIKLNKYFVIILPSLFLVILIVTLIIQYFGLQPESWSAPTVQWEVPFFKAVYSNFSSYISSQQIFVLAGFLTFAVVSLLPKSKKLDFSIPIIMLVMTFLFILGTVLQAVDAAGHRYIIMLYPYSIILSVWAFSFFKKKYIIFIIIAIISLVDIAILYPKFYIFYNNKTTYTTQKPYSWAIGGYDLAQELNKLPNAKDITVYADRFSINHFFDGYTETIFETQISKINEFDYLCLSKAGRSQVNMSPALEDYYTMPKDSFEYYLGSEKHGWIGLIKVDKNKKDIEIKNTFDPELYLNLSKSFTIAFWETHDSLSPGKVIYIGQNYLDGIECNISNNTLEIKYSEDEIYFTDVLNTNKPNSIVLQHYTKYKIQNIDVWVNGERVITQEVKTIKQRMTKFFIATDFKGSANDMRVYKQKLSAGQIEAIYNNGEMTLEQNLLYNNKEFIPTQHFTHK